MWIGVRSTNFRNFFLNNLDTRFPLQDLAFAPRGTKEVAYKTLVWPKLEYAAPIWSPYSKLQINQIKIQREFREQQPVRPAGDGETQVVSIVATCSLVCSFISAVVTKL